jgi:5-methylcytosine-specific restriction enzyme A
MKKSCRYCGIVPANHVCTVALKNKSAMDAKREDKKFYKTIRWQNLRLEVLKNQDYICLWSLYVEGIIRQANTAHHIVEILIDKSKAYDIDNLIGLNETIHDTVHKLYKTNKDDTIKIIEECNRLWADGIKLEGLGTLNNELDLILG